VIDNHNWPLPLTEEQLDDIAERAAERAVQKVFDRISLEVGRSILRKSAYVIGALVLVAAAWLIGGGHIKP